MRIEKSQKLLKARSYIDFGDENCVFCKMPFVYLVANYKDSSSGWKPFSIKIIIRDHDDFEYGMLYKTDEEHFFQVLHELINWMVDHEQGISDIGKLFHSPYDFFPDCGCEVELWT